jgi:hypothetical protein
MKTITVDFDHYAKLVALAAPQAMALENDHLMDSKDEAAARAARLAGAEVERGFTAIKKVLAGGEPAALVGLFHGSESHS